MTQQNHHHDGDDGERESETLNQTLHDGLLGSQKERDHPGHDVRCSGCVAQRFGDDPVEVGGQHAVIEVRHQSNLSAYSPEFGSLRDVDVADSNASLQRHGCDRNESLFPLLLSIPEEFIDAGDGMAKTGLHQKRGIVRRDFERRAEVGEGQRSADLRMRGDKALDLSDQLQPFDGVQPRDRLMATNLLDRKSTRLNSSHTDISRMPSSA